MRRSLTIFLTIMSVARLSAQTPARGSAGVAVAGVVQDQTGAIIPAAQVTLTLAGAANAAQAVMTVMTDNAGAFRIEHVTPGTYELRVEFARFKPHVTRVRVGNRAPGSTTVVLQIEGVKQEITVGGGIARASADAASNLNAITVDADALDNLPVLDQDIVGAMARFLDASSIGTGGITLVVDGMEVHALNVSASAVQQIKINQDPYAAEFARPGRGRIEIITKPGGRDYSGALNFRFRDNRFAARNAFAVTKPAEQRRTFEGSFGGPLAGIPKTNFMVSGSHGAEDTQSIVFADTLTGAVRLNVATPATSELLSAIVNHQQGDKHTMSFRFSHRAESDTNQGVGGFNLPDVGSNHHNREDELSYGQQTVISPHLLNEFRFMVGDERETRVSVRPDRRIVVQDAFVGGGAQNDTLRTEHHFTLVETVTWSRGPHTVKTGFNIPDWSWRGFDDRSNTGGTFSFSSLQDYALGRAYAFTQQLGNGHTLFLEKILGAFIQDEIRVRPNLSVDMGLRYDWQNFFHDNNNLAPRFSFAYAPGEKRDTVVRGGAGVFYDRSGEGPIRDILRYDGQHLLRYVIVDPGYPNPLAPGQTLGAQPVSIVRLSPDAPIPYTIQYSTAIERQLRPKTTLAITFVGSRGVDLFRSRDVNAPPPPAFASRPDPEHGVVRQIESAGRLNAASLQFTLRGQVTKFFNGSAEYSFGRAYNDTNGVNWMPPNSYDLSLEYARADFNQRHRLELFGIVNAGKNLNVGASLSMASGRPYSLTTGGDDFNTGSANARPAGAARNSLEGPGFANLDLRWSREFVVSNLHGRKHTLTAGVDAFNVLNRVNYSYFVGNMSSPFFGHAIAAQAPRRTQFSLRVRY